ncbi:MAG: C40 family peptidase [Bacteroidetes bacterium]|nr:C40 family peptidase [Bacteroidota bacterium]
MKRTNLPTEQKNKTKLIKELPKNLTKKRQIIVIQAIENLGKPYKWGGQSPGQGFDCSGLVVYTHGKAGIWVPRTSKDQYRNGRPLSKPALEPGDLVFFNIPEKKTGLHVGIFIGKGQFIHAPGSDRQVSLASLNNFYFNQNFKGVRSYL